MASGICTSRLPPRLFPSLQQYNTASRSEEHTSELQSQSNLVCRLLLEKKKSDGVLNRVTSCADRQHPFKGHWTLSHVPSLWSALRACLFDVTTALLLRARALLVRLCYP